jgi:hypothetical protein
MFAKLAFAAALLSLGAVSAQALPAAPVQPGFDESGDVTLVADGCGPGFFRNDFGRCRPIRRAPGVVVVPEVVVAPPVIVPVVRGCPPGTWRNRRGDCVY